MGPAPQARNIWLTAVVLALGAAVSLGLARFSYALLLPTMREALGWSYFTAGAMNTVNAAGYLAGALAAPALFARFGARAALLGGTLLAALVLAGHGLVTGDAALYTLRFGAGASSAAVFVAGGLMAARLGSRPAPPGSGITPALVLGLYYGGTGLGIVASALLLPPLALVVPAPAPLGLAGWRAGWLVLAALAAAAALPMRWRWADLDGAPAAPSPAVGSPAGVSAGRAWQGFGYGLASYFMFGLGYIGYMTFIVTLLREQGLGTLAVAGFYALLGCGVMVSPWLWAGLLQRHRGGRPLATLNALLSVATLLPVLGAQLAPPWPGALAFASGMLFGGVFLSVVASTTALVRHNLPSAQWSAGISAFTIVFAAGQIIGPSLVGRLADGPGGLGAGLVLSAAVLAGAALLAALQRPRLPAPPQPPSRP